MAHSTAWALAFGVPLLLLPAAAAQTVAFFSPTGTQQDLQTAVDSLAGGGVVVVPPGTWELHGSVNVTDSGVTIIGAGAWHSVLHRDAPPADADAATRKLYTDPFLRSKGNSTFRLSSVGIASWKATAGKEDRDTGIILSDVEDFRVDRCVFRYTGSAAVSSQGDSQGVVDHCSFTDI